MSKELYIIRHAKSDWSFELKDFDRPLSPRGFRDAPVMAERLKVSVPNIDVLVSSPAKRAITTAQVFAEVLGIPIKDIQTQMSIYDAGVPRLLDVINQVDDSISKLAIFGHNPGFTMFANYLSDANIYNIPTCGIIGMRFDGVDSWGEISGGMGDSFAFMYPKDGQ